MLTNREELDQLFQDKLRDFSPYPPQFIWESIESRLNEKTGSDYHLKTILAAAVLLALILTGWWYHPYTSMNPGIIENTVKKYAQIIPEMQEKNGISDPNKLEKEQKDVFTPESKPERNVSVFNTKPPVRTVPESQGIDSRSAQPGYEKKGNPDFVADTKRIAGTTGILSKDEAVVVNNTRLISKGKTLTDKFQKRKASPWSVELKASPFLTAGLKNLPGQQSSEGRSFSGGFLAGYQVSQRVRISSGLLINNLNRNTTVVNPALVNLPENASQIQEGYKFCEIPLKINYKIKKRKLNVDLTGGLSAQILAAEKNVVKTNSPKTEIEVPNHAPEVTYAGMIGLEIGYQMSKKITVTLEPLLKRYLTSFHEKSEVDFQTYQAGIYTGVRYSFN